MPAPCSPDYPWTADPMVTVQLRKWLYLSDYADILNRGYLYGKCSCTSVPSLLTSREHLYIMTLCVIHSYSEDRIIMDTYVVHIKIYVYTINVIYYVNAYMDEKGWVL